MLVFKKKGKLAKAKYSALHAAGVHCTYKGLK